MEQLETICRCKLMIQSRYLDNQTKENWENSVVMNHGTVCNTQLSHLKAEFKIQRPVIL